MLTGEYKHSVDAKNRLFIPAKHREELGTSFMIVKDVRGPRLKVFSMEAWEAYIAPIRAQDRQLSERTLRFLHRDAVTAEPDSQGRVLLTPKLLAYAGITKEAVIIGCADYCEIWSAERYSVEIEAEDDADLLRAELEQLGL